MRHGIRFFVPTISSRLLLISGFLLSGCGSPGTGNHPTGIPIIDAARNGDVKTVIRIVDADKSALKQVDDKGLNAAHWAILCETDSVFFALAERGYPLDDPEILVCCCSRASSAKILDYVLQHGSNPNRQIGEGWTALNMAVNNGFDELVDVLLKHGVDLKLKDGRGKDAFETLDDTISFINDPHSIWRHENAPSEKQVTEALARPKALKQKLEAFLKTTK